MASNVMQYLDMQRESEEQKRVTTMSKGLAAFTEGRQRIPSEWKSLRSADTGTTRAHARQIDEHQNSEKYFAPSKDLAAPEASSSYDHHSPAPQRRSRRDSGVGLNRVSQSHAEVLARGSNLLRESLNVHVTVFFDTRTGAVQPGKLSKPNQNHEDFVLINGSLEGCPRIGRAGEGPSTTATKQSNKHSRGRYSQLLY